VARAAARQALLPSLLLPTAVGYGRPVDSDEVPLPEILIVDSRLAAGSPPQRTAHLGMALYSAALEPYLSAEPMLRDTVEVPLQKALGLLVDHLPRAVAAPDDPAPRAGLADATGLAARGLAAVGRRPQIVEEAARRLGAAGSAADDLRAGILTSLLKAGSEGRGPFPRERIAALGRAVLGVREPDDGRAASWAAGGIRQWVVNLGLEPALPAAVAARAAADEVLGTWMS
jgi:alcohol dehydrogenase class IV